MKIGGGVSGGIVGYVAEDVIDNHQTIMAILEGNGGSNSGAKKAGTLIMNMN